MGQHIEIISTTVDAQVAAFHTDRGITGQDGVSFDAETADESFPGALAGRLFAGVDGIDHVFVASNQVVVRRPDGWDDGQVDAARSVIEQFFVFYADA